MKLPALRTRSLNGRLRASAAPSRHFRTPEPLEARVVPAAIVWTGGGGDLKWNTAANWNGGVVPGVNDDVTIDVPGTITVALGGGTHSIRSLDSHENLLIDNGSLVLAAASSISGNLTLTGTTVTANGTLTISGAATFGEGATIDGTGSTTLTGTSSVSGNFGVNEDLTNTGTLNANGGRFYLGNTAKLTNASGAIFNAQGDTVVQTTGTFENAGTINVISGAEAFTTTFNNTGTLNVDGGSIEFRNSGTNSGIFDVDDGATMILGATTYHLAAGAQLKGVGLYRVTGFGTVEVAAGLTVTPANLQIDAFSFFGGPGNTTIQNHAVATMDGGSFYGAGKTTVALGGIVKTTSTGGGLEAHTMDVYGEFDLNSGAFSIHNASTLNIQVGGVANATGRSTFYGGASVLNILGTLNVDAAGTFLDESAVTASVSGTIHVISGNLSIAEGITSNGGIFNADAGSFVSFNGRNSTMNSGTQWNGLGHYYVNGGGVAIASGTAITVHDLHINNTVTNSGTLSLNAGGTLVFDGAIGSLAGSGVTNIAATASSSGSFNFAGTLNNSGTVTGNVIQGGTFNNLAGATLSMTPDSVLGRAGFLFGWLKNSGTVNFDASGAQAAFFQADLLNNGVVSVTGGALSFGVTNNVSTSQGSGEFHANAGATITFNGSGYVFNAGSSLTGTGTFGFSSNVTLADAALNFSPQHLNVHATITGPGRLTAASGAEWTLVTGSFKDMGEFTVQSGALVHVGSMLLDGTTARNFGVLNFDQSFGSLALKTGGLLTNEASGVIRLDSHASGGFFGNGGTLVNHGLISRGGTDPFAVNTFLASFSNDGIFEVSNGQVFISGAVTQVSNDGLTLQGGTWRISNGASLTLNSIATQDFYGNPLVTIVNNAADVTVSGAGASFNAVRNLATNSGSLRILDGATYSTSRYEFQPAVDPTGPLPGPLTNSGTLEIGSGSTVSVTTAYTQTSTGTLLLHVGAAATNQGSGRLAVTQAAALDGTLAVLVDGTYVPAIGDAYTLATYASVTGDFATLEGLQPLFVPLKSATQYTATAQSVPSDLVPISITPPASGGSGQSITIPYTIKNTAVAATAASAWTDSIYLSTSATFDSSAILLGRVPHAGALAAGASYNGQFAGNLPALPAGVYHVFILTDSGAKVAESDNSNNLLAAAGTLTVTVPTLTPGTAINGTISAGQDLLFRVDLPDAASRIQLTGAQLGEAELYLRAGAAPSRSVSDAYGFDAASVAQSLTVADPVTGDYYILLHGRESAGTNAAFSLSADAIPFSVENTGPIAGTNNGEVTLTIHGAQLSSATAFTLVPHSGVGPSLSPALVQVRDGTTVFATFNLRSAALGDYDLHAQNGGTSTTLTDAFNVLAAPILDPDLQVSVSLIAPVGIRVGSVSTVLVSYVNPTGHDLPAPLLVLTGDNAVFHSDDEHFTHFVEFFATDPNGPSDVLPAGYHGSRFFTFEPEVAQAGLVTKLNLGTVDATALLDLDKLEIEARPPTTMSDADWALVSAKLAQNLGPNYGVYANKLRADMALIPAEFGDARAPVNLLRVELLDAEAELFTSVRGHLTAAEAGVDLTGRTVLATNTATGEVFDATSLEDGSFTFAQITAGAYTFAVQDELAGALAPLAVASGAHVTAVSLPVSIGKTLQGAVVNEPASGATISATDQSGVTYSADADANGHYEFHGLAPGVYQIATRAEGRAETLVDNVAVGANGAVLDLTLPAESVIGGHALFHTGGSAASVTTVTAHLIGGNVSSFANAAADGSFAIHGLGAGAYQLTFSREGFVSEVVNNFVVGAGATADVGTHTLALAGSITGTVTSSDPAISGALGVGAFLNGTLVASATTDATGHFTLNGLPAGAYAVKTLADTAFETDANTTLAEGQQLSGVQIGIQPGGVIAGTVKDGNAVAIKNLQVFADAPDGSVLSTFTDANGHYEFDHLAIGVYHLHLPVDGAHHTAMANVTSLAGTPVQADLDAAIGGVLTGHLYLPGNTPVAGGLVVLLLNGQKIASSTTSTDGTYRFLLSAAGNYTVEAASDKGTFPVATNIAVGAGATVSRDLTAGNGSLDLTITNSSGAVAGTQVQLVDATSGLTVTTATLTASGNFHVDHLAAGNYRVVAAGASNLGAQATINVAASGTTAMSAPLMPQSSVHGTVTFAGTIAPDATITAYVRGQTDKFYSTSIAADGTYSLGQLPAGNYDLVAVNNGALANVTQNIVVNNTAVLDVSLTPSGSTMHRGRVTDTSGNVIVGALVVAVDGQGREVGHATTDMNGIFNITTAIGSDLTLRISRPTVDPFGVFDQFQASTWLQNENKTEPTDLILLFPAVGDDNFLGGFFDFLANTPLGQFAKAQELFKEDKIKADRFTYLPQHVFDRFEQNNACIGCDDDRNAAKAAKNTQDHAYDGTGEFMGQPLYVDSAKGTAGKLSIEIVAQANQVINDTATIANFLLSIVPLGQAISKLAAAGKVVQGTVAAGKLETCLNIFQNLLTSSASEIQLMNDVNNPDKKPEDEQALVDQSAAGLTTVQSAAVALESALVDLRDAAAVAKLGQLSNFGAVLSAVTGFKDAAEALNYTKSFEALDKVLEAKLKFKNAEKAYDKTVPLAKEKAEAYYKCLQQNAANANCSPKPPNPNIPTPPNKPLPQGPPGSGPVGTTQGRSFDPNDIIGPAGFGSEHFVGTQNALPYTIHFENQASATASAAQVQVSQQLDSDLNFASLQLTSFGFGGRTFEIPSGRSSFSEQLDLRDDLGVFVDFSAAVDLTTGQLHWTLSAIDPLTGDVSGDTLLGLLPPNVDGTEGVGFVSYTVAAKSTAHTGDVIDAQASIIFDSNDPISTAAISNTIDSIAPSTHVNAISNTGTSGPDFTVSWTGSDDANGSGLSTFDVFVSKDGAKYQPLVLGTTHHAAVFAGQVGHSYQFVVAGTDGGGNVEALPTVADASIAVVAGNILTLDSKHPVTVHGPDQSLVTVSLSGHGTGTVSLVNGVLDTADLRAITLTGTDAASALKITTARGGHVNVGRITTSGAADSLGSVTFSGGAVLGDGLDDTSTDLAIGGAVKSIALGDVAAFTMIKVGSGLSDALAAKATVAFTMHDALGAGVTTDFATQVGAIKVHAWEFNGSLGARLGAKSLAVATGNFSPSVDLDAAGTAAGTANLGAVTISAGSLDSPLFAVEGKLTSLTVKDEIASTIKTGSAGNITAGGIFFSTITAATGSLGNITSSQPIIASVIKAPSGALGAVTVAMSKQSGMVAAISGTIFEAKSIGSVTASVTGGANLSGARGIVSSLFSALHGSLGNVSATVSGAKLNDGAAIEGTTFSAPDGNIGNVTARATSGDAAPFLAAIRQSEIHASGKIGNLTAIAVATSKAPTGGFVAALQGADGDVAISGGSIGKLVASAAGSDGAVAVDINTGQRLNVTATTSIAGIILAANKSKKTGAFAYAISRASFVAGTDIGPIAISGNVTGTQVFDTLFAAGGKISSVAVSATNKISGTLIDSFIIAGQSHAIVTRTDLVAASLGAVTLSGSLDHSQILATGNIGAVKIGNAASGAKIVAGVNVGSDQRLATGDDIYNGHASIASVTVGGTFSATTIAAGIDAGSGFVFGDADDAAGTLVAGITARSKIGAIKLGASTVTGNATAPLTSNGSDHANAIESLSLTSLRIGTGLVFKNFATAGYIDADSNGTEDIAEVVVRVR